MKKVLAALILIVFMFNIMGYYFVFSYNQYLVRREMKSQIRAGYFEESLFVLNIINPSLNPDFKRIDKGEFRYKGKLYDIISEKNSGNMTTFHCINDKNEEKLLAGFHHYFELASTQNNPAKARHAQALLYHVIKLALTESLLIKPPQKTIELSFIIPLYPLSSIFHSPASPPPKFA
jgi:hypothetical protein